jgi:hypothetical protein
MKSAPNAKRVANAENRITKIDTHAAAALRLLLLSGCRSPLAKASSPRFTHSFSLLQHDLTSLDLIAAKTSDRLAVRADDRQLASDCDPQVRAVTRIDRFFECDEPRALRNRTPNGEVPLRCRTKIGVCLRVIRTQIT